VGSPRVVISKIGTDSPFADSKLMVGQTVMSINGTKCPVNAQAAAQLIKDAGDEVTIIAASLIATVRKSTKETKVGLTLVQKAGYISVLNIAPQSLFSHTYLREGQRVVSINDQEFNADVAEAVGLVKQTEGLLKVVAVDVVTRKSYRVPVDKSEGHVTVTFKKESKDDRVGVRVIRSHQGHIVVSHIAEDGLLAGSELQLGQRIISINGTPCPDLTTDAMKLVKEADGDVTIVASNSVAKAEKASKDHKAGLGLAKSEDGSIVVRRLGKDCLFDLELKQKIISINGEPCPEGLEETINVLKEGEGPMTIVAVDTFVREETKTPEVTPPKESPEPEGDQSAEPQEEKAEPAVESTGEPSKVEEETPVAPPAEDSKEEKAESEKGELTNQEEGTKTEEDKEPEAEKDKS